MITIRNNTLSNINLKQLGVTVLASSTYTIQSGDLLSIYSEDNSLEISNLIDSGDISIELDGVTLSLFDAKRKFKFPNQSVNVNFNNTNTSITSTNVQDAIVEAKNIAEGKARFTITLVHNGTYSNNEFVGYSELVSGDTSPIIFPRDCILEDITFVNNKTNADYRFEYRKNSTTGTPFLTVSYDNTQTFILNDIEESFSSGDRIYIKYKDEGSNARDSVMVLYMRLT